MPCYGLSPCNSYEGFIFFVYNKGPPTFVQLLQVGGGPVLSMPCPSEDSHGPNAAWHLQAAEPPKRISSLNHRGLRGYVGWFDCIFKVHVKLLQDFKGV